MLKIAKNLSLPLELVTQTLGILAKRRAGKSFAARRISEQLHHKGQQIVIVDPKGDWWGIRSSSDGKEPGLPVIILGGERGDVRLEPSAGEVVAKLVIEERVSALLDLSLFRKHEVATFMATFLENLYRLKAREQYRTPMMLLIDEADAVAPQKPQKGEERMLGAAEDIVRRGGQRGIGCTLITQRSAVLNKNVLTQIQVLIALRTIAPQDLAALDAWIDVHGTPEERKALMESLPALPTGEAWVWSPGWPTNEGIFEHVHILPIETFDSGATPKPGEKRVEPKNLADVDLKALQRQMAETIERAKADDPRELRRQIAELKASQKKAAPAPVVDVKTLELVRNEGWEKGYNTAVASFRVAFDLVREDINKALLFPHIGKEPRTAVPRIPLIARSIPSRPSAPRDAPKGRLGIGEMKILNACAQYPRGVTREQLTILTGYKRSSRDTYLQRLQARGYIQIDTTITTTAEGVMALGSSFEPLPTGEELRAYWMGRLPEGEKRIFEVILQAYPQTVARESLDETIGYKRSSRDTYIQRLRARQLVKILGRGELRANEELFT